VMSFNKECKLVFMSVIGRILAYIAHTLVRTVYIMKEDMCAQFWKK